MNIIKLTKPKFSTFLMSRESRSKREKSQGACTNMEKDIKTRLQRKSGIKKIGRTSMKEITEKGNATLVNY